MAYDFSRRVAIITGGAGGIGFATAKQFVDCGARVALLDRNKGLLDDAVARLPGALPFHLDVTQPAEVKDAVARVEQEFGQIDCLVSVAGGGSPTTIEGASHDDWNRIVALNLSAPFYCIQAVAPVMRRGGGGTIVTVGSLAALQISLNNGVSYTAAKSGVLGLTRHAAFELARDGIRVNAVLPGPIMTPQMDAKIDPRTRADIPRRVPLGRWLTPEEVAGPILFFCSDASSGCTGTHVLVDGGMHIAAPSDPGTYFSKRATT